MRSRRFLLPIAILLVAGGAAPLPAQSRSVGQLLEAVGRIEIRRAGQKPLRGSFQSPLMTGDLLRVRTGRAEVVLFQNGARFLLRQGSAARVEPMELKPRSGPAPRRLYGLNLDFVRGTTRPIQPVDPKLREILGVVVRAGPDDELGPRQPRPNGAERTGPVTLRWAGPVEGDRLHLQIRDAGHTLHETDLPVTAREFAVPDGLLQPGKDYAWFVTAVQGADNGPTSAALVRVLAPTERTEIERMEQQARTAQAASPRDPDPLLLLAQAYERMRLYADARAAYEAVLRLRPGDTGARQALRRLPGR